MLFRSPVYTDKDTHGLPRLKLGRNSFDECIQTMNRLMSDLHTPFTKVCAKCSLYTLYSTEKYVDGWKVNEVLFSRTARRLFEGYAYVRNARLA